MELVADHVSVHFGGVLAVDDVTLRLAQGEILGLIGPNGAGKTTMVNVLSGFQMPHTGAVSVAGERVKRWSRHHLVRLGVVRTFQAVRLFKRMSVSENVEVGCLGLGLSRVAARRQARHVLAEVGLEAKADMAADALSYGDERRVGLARALALQPRFLLLDEPAAGLNAAEAEDLRHLIAALRQSLACGILVIEHNVQLVMQLCDRIHVLASGKSLAMGTPAEIRADAQVRRAYLGSEAA